MRNRQCSIVFDSDNQQAVKDGKSWTAPVCLTARRGELPTRCTRLGRTLIAHRAVEIAKVHIKMKGNQQS
jgi:hypothetical protein